MAQRPITWDPERYLAYADERGRPFVDLVSRIPGYRATIVDLGCGPGQLTHVLRERWPEAQITGVDSSPEMIERADADNKDPYVEYVLADAATWMPPDRIDLLISNAMFQWIPDRLESSHGSPR